MKLRWLGALSAAALLGSAGAAGAVVVVVVPLSGPASDGSFSGDFMAEGLAAGPFSEEFDFVLPLSGTTGATISSIETSSTDNVDFTSVMLDGTNFTVGVTGTVEFRFVPGIQTSAGTQTLLVSGVSGGDGAFAGTVAFTPSVAEPAAWALIIAGVGAVGAALRGKRRRASAWA